MAGQACARCGNPAPSSSYLCGGCTLELRAALERIPDLVGDLEVALSKQARISDAGRRTAGAEQPLPLNLGAAEALAGLRAVLRRALVDAVPSTRPSAALSAVVEAQLLRRHLPLLLGAPGAGRHAQAIGDAVAEALVLIDRPEAQWYAGICWAWVEGNQCPADLYGIAGAPVVTCAACGAEHDAARRRAWLLEQVDDQLAYASQLALAISGLGAEVSSARIRKWSERGRIIAHGKDHRGRPLYRVGDVLDALQAELSKTKNSA